MCCLTKRNNNQKVTQLHNECLVSLICLLYESGDCSIILSYPISGVCMYAQYLHMMMTYKYIYFHTDRLGLIRIPEAGKIPWDGTGLHQVVILLDIWLWTITFGFSQTKNPEWPPRSAHSSVLAMLPLGQVTEPCSRLFQLISMEELKWARQTRRRA